MLLPTGVEEPVIVWLAQPREEPFSGSRHLPAKEHEVGGDPPFCTDCGLGAPEHGLQSAIASKQLRAIEERCQDFIREAPPLEIIGAFPPDGLHEQSVQTRFLQTHERDGQGYSQLPGRDEAVLPRLRPEFLDPRDQRSQILGAQRLPEAFRGVVLLLELGE